MGVITEIISDIFNIGKNVTIGPILQLLSDQSALDELIFLFASNRNFLNLQFN